MCVPRISRKSHPIPSSFERVPSQSLGTCDLAGTVNVNEDDEFFAERTPAVMSSRKTSLDAILLCI